MYHFVWIPKYRHKVFSKPYADVLKAMIVKTAYDYDMEVKEIEIPKDHVHMAIETEPRMSPSEIMRIIKSVSAIEFFKKYPKIKEKYFWGSKLWTNSYYVETVGNRNEQEVKRYVQEQINKEDKSINKSLKQLKLV